MENKPASLLVASLGKTLNKMPPSLCGRQVVGPSSLPVVVAPVQLNTCKPSVSANAVQLIHTSSCIMLTTNAHTKKVKRAINRRSGNLWAIFRPYTNSFCLDKFGLIVNRTFVSAPLLVALFTNHDGDFSSTASLI